MKIFNLSDQLNSLTGMDSGRFWLSLNSFSMKTLELKNQDLDISRTKLDFETTHTLTPFMANQEKYEKAERMV